MVTLKREKQREYRDSWGPKFVYWLPKESVSSLLSIIKEKIRRVKAPLCAPLDYFKRSYLIEPEAWENSICPRVEGWYRNSDYAGMYLLVSYKLIDILSPYATVRLTLTDEHLDTAPCQEEIRELFTSNYPERYFPKKWFQVAEKEKKRYVTWLKLKGIDIDFETLFKYHTANHLNFIRPLILKNGDIPQSIAGSAYLCSCCLELYNIVGRDYSRKLVIPCIGATYFANLPMDRFILVETI